MIVVVDYGMGNLHSVAKALEKAGGEVSVSSDPAGVRRADKLVLPGVGAFADAKTELDRRGLTGPVLEHIRAGRPFLGICLGLQLLFERSHEDGEHAGLGVVTGEVVRFRASGLKVPHIGWNALEMTPGVALFAGVPDGSRVYFVHSYYVAPSDASVIAARTEYGETFTSAVATDNVWATQFHPEKSQRVGLRMLENFVEW
ncbi:MAG TPA: imidazole glycerol phosphate synthase subunit HisH [Planctomycetota bacterium]|nr:imidazole glycerol phosphate synthase subunit HisH [Planctomycetota bacterium]HUV39288.1 imidazole glycerol phosphate synthase subunit HisH [Planctomycetota bacterium]